MPVLVLISYVLTLDLICKKVHRGQKKPIKIHVLGCSATHLKFCITATNIVQVAVVFGSDT